MGLYGQYPVVFKNCTVGTAAVESRGLLTVISASCRDVCPGRIMRLRAVTGAGGADLGVAIPAGGLLCFGRSFTRNDLACMGISDISGFTLTDSGADARAPHVWRPLKEPERILRDADLIACCRKYGGVCWRRAGDKTYIGAPFGEDRPFPLMPAFCFGRPETVNGCMWLVFEIRDGLLVTDVNA